MTVSISRIDGPLPVRAVPDPPRNDARGSGKTDFAGDLASASAVPSPPPEVSAEVREAAKAAANLLEQGRELRFDRGDDGRLRVQLQDLHGNVLRPVPPGEIFEFAEGKVTS
jgi:hypothetical protein